MIKFEDYFYKKFTYGLTYSGGRNRLGRITVRHRGSKSKSKRKFLAVDLKNSTRNLKWILLHVRCCPRRTAHIGLILYENGLFSYILALRNSIIGTVWSVPQLHREVIPQLGSYVIIGDQPEGSSLYNIEIYLGRGGQLARSAGNSARILNRFRNKNNKVLLRLRSGDEYLVNANCMANLGVVSNPEHSRIDLKKAGVRKYHGFRSHVRGVAMNPVDHPHGVELQEGIHV